MSFGLLIFVVVGRNVKEDGFNTLLNIHNLSRLNSFSNYKNVKVIVIDDNSSDESLNYLNQGIGLFNDNRISTELIKNDQTKGFAGSILIACSSQVLSARDCVLILPANNQIDSNELNKLLELKTATNIVLGERINKSNARPYLKVISSNILQLFFKRLIDKNISDITGFWFVPFVIIQKGLRSNDGHSFIFKLYWESQVQGIEIVTTSVNLLTDYKQRRGNLKGNALPKPKNIMYIVLGFIKLFFLKRSFINKF